MKLTYLCQRGSRNLRGGCLEWGVHGSRVGAHTNVDNVAFAVDHDITIVAVLDLKYIARYGVPCH